MFIQALRDCQNLDPETLDSTVKRFQGKSVLVVGDVMLDEYLIGEVRRISPEAPVPIVETTHQALVAGGAANVASNIVSLGGRAVLIGIVGKDAGATSLSAVLASHGIVSDTLIAADDRPTTTKTRIVSGQQQIVRIDKEVKTKISEDLASSVLATFDRQIEQADACLVSDYAKGLLTPAVCRHIISRARQLGKPVIVDPKGQDFSKYAGCSIITPNVRETEAASGQVVSDENSLFRAAQHLLNELGQSALLITRGSDGMTLFRHEEQIVHAPALAKEVFDVTGAGDTVVSTLALCLALGTRLEEAMMLSNVAASIVVQKTGTATVSPAELLNSRGRQKSSEPAKKDVMPVRSFSSIPNQFRLTQ